MGSEIETLDRLLTHCELRGFTFTAQEVGPHDLMIGVRDSDDCRDTILIGTLERCWGLREELTEHTPVQLVRGTAAQVTRAVLGWGVTMTFRPDDKVADALT